MPRKFLMENALFLASWLRNPKRMGAAVPSSAFLARAIAAQIDPRMAGTVVELGGGTGAVTRALLQRGLPPERLLVIERDRNLQRLLADRFPQVQVLQGDALHLTSLLRELGVSAVSTVVSGLPLLAMPVATRRSILQQGFGAMERNGVFIQFTYAPFSPISDQILRALGLRSDVAARVLRNIPPATVWCYRRYGLAVESAA